VDTGRLGLIGRTSGGGRYVRLTDRLDMPRLTPEQATASARRGGVATHAPLAKRLPRAPPGLRRRASPGSAPSAR
jgi:hypothetical protein